MEQDHWKAVAIQITERGYDSVRACDGTWMAAWARGFRVPVTPYVLRYYNIWEVVPLEWDDDWVETANETAVLPVAGKSLRGPNQIKIMQKRTGTRTTDTDWNHDIHEPMGPGSNVKRVQRSK